MTETATESFRRMDQSTKADWDRIAVQSVEAWSLVPERILELLRSLEHITVGFRVNQLIHGLQTATRAERAGADEDIIVASLCHDIAKSISEPNHPAIAAELLTPYVRDEVAWMVRVHQDFQGRHYYEHIGKNPGAREQHRDHPHYDLAERFADEWDQTSFDPDYDTLPLTHFEPLVRQIFAAPHHV